MEKRRIKKKPQNGMVSPENMYWQESQYDSWVSSCHDKAYKWEENDSCKNSVLHKNDCALPKSGNISHAANCFITNWFVMTSQICILNN